MFMSSNKWQSTESKTLFKYIAHTVSQTKTNLKIQNCYEVCWVYAIYSQLNKECITSAWSATLSLLSKIYSIFKWFWYSCTLHAVSTKPNIKFISLVLLESIILFSTVCSNGLHLHLPISVSLPSSYLFLWLCSSMNNRPKHSYTKEGLLLVHVFPFLHT